MIKKSLITFVALSIVASGLNYIIYPLFSRILSSAEYVNITVALSLFTQISAFLSSILAITIGLSKDSPDGKMNEKLELLQAFLFKLFIILASIFLLLSPIIMVQLHTPVLFAVPIALMMLFSLPILIISGYLNGKNEMIKLGVVALVSASSQFVIGLTVAYLSHNGLLSMLSMIAAQLVTLLVLYGIFAKDKLPGIIKPLKIPLRALRGKQMGPLVIYTALTALAIMAISLVQIADLFIVQNLINVDVKFYADIYVVSRIVFFGGMIFIWPFLGEISLDHHHFNRKPFFKLMIYFTAIMLAAVIALFFFGDKLINILFGPSYDIHLVRVIAILAVLYKYFLLVITAIILYFVVLRNYAAVWLSITAASLVLIYAALINKASSLPTLLIGLTIIAALVAITAVIMLLHTPVKKSRE